MTMMDIRIVISFTLLLCKKLLYGVCISSTVVHSCVTCEMCIAKSSERFVSLANKLNALAN